MIERRCIIKFLTTATETALVSTLEVIEAADAIFRPVLGVLVLLDPTGHFDSELV
jgi:hypothetical protein